MKIEEAWEYEDTFPIDSVTHKDSDIKHLIHLDNEFSVETWVLANGLVVNYLMGRFGTALKDIKARWGYASVQDAVSDAKNLIT